MRTPWYRHFIYRKQVLKTTWKLRLLIVIVLVAAVVVPHAFWARKIGQSLVCKEQVGSSDALLIENFDINYLIFERAAALQRAGVSAKAFVPIGADTDSNEVSRQFVEVMARTAKLEKFETIPIQEKEPISRNAAEQIRDFLTREHIKSVVVLSPGFRSRRSEMVYKAVLEPAGIRVGCLAVFGMKTTLNWSSTWHGIQEVGLQFLKLQYYRFYVLL
jgi:hypothetical protein